jgi:hypothetical protein
MTVSASPSLISQEHTSYVLASLGPSEHPGSNHQDYGSNVVPFKYGDLGPVLWQGQV